MLNYCLFLLCLDIRLYFNCELHTFLIKSYFRNTYIYIQNSKILVSQLRVIQNPYENRPIIVPIPSQKVFGMVLVQFLAKTVLKPYQNSIQNHSRTSTKRLHNRSKSVSKANRNRFKTLPKPFKLRSQTVAKLPQNRTKTELNDT